MRTREELAEALAQAEARMAALEAALVEREAAGQALTETLIRHVPAGLSFLDPALVFRWVKASSTVIAGLDPQDLVGRSLYDLFDRDRVDQLWRPAVENGVPLERMAFPFGHAPDGRPLYWDLAVVPVVEGGTVMGALITACDVTERVENERLQAERLEYLMALDQLKQNFLSAASHELRTPLTAIGGFAEFLEDEFAGPLTEGQRHYVAQIQEGRRRLQCVVDDLLDFARLEAGTFSLIPHEADLVRLIEGMIASHLSQAEAADVRLEAALPAAPVILTMDARRVEQVLNNLVGNAIKFSRPGGCVRVALELPEEGVCLTVSDTGIGIAPEHQEKVFQRFYQVDPSLTREQGGTGLGLAICSALVEAHGGTIALES
ncbi:MAG: sensor histidine kinase, partial [Candidatus Sericytochromatia bacterium]